MVNNNLESEKIFKNVWYSTLDHQDTLRQKLESGRWRAFLAPWKFIVYIDSGNFHITTDSIMFLGKKVKLKISKIEKISRYTKSGKAPINHYKFEWIRTDYRTDKDVRKTALFVAGSHGIRVTPIINKTNELYEAIISWVKGKSSNDKKEIKN